MNTIIEKIRAEVLRLIRESEGPGSQYGFGMMSACNRILNFLDTLKEQPVCEGFDGEFSKFSNDVDAEHPFPICVDEFKDFASHFYELGCRRTAEKYDEIEYKRQRTDVCEGLEEEIEMYFEDWDSNPNGTFFDKEGYKIGIIALKNIARHFAQWGAEHLKR